MLIVFFSFVSGITLEKAYDLKSDLGISEAKTLLCIKKVRAWTGCDVEPNIKEKMDQRKREVRPLFDVEWLSLSASGSS